MVDGINAGNGVEAGFGKWKLLVRVHNTEVRAALKATLTRKGTCCGDRLFVNINSGNRATGESHDSKSRTASAATDIQESFAGGQVKPTYELILLIRSEPAVLSNVFTVGFSTNVLI